MILFRDEHAFDRLPVAEPEQKLHRAVGAFLHPDHLGPGDDRHRGQTLAQGLGNVGHVDVGNDEIHQGIGV